MAKTSPFGFEKIQDARDFLKIWNTLPDFCYAILPTAPDRVVKVFRLVNGYFETGFPSTELDNLNKELGVTQSQIQAMLAGSMFGWNRWGCDPAGHENKGKK